MRYGKHITVQGNTLLYQYYAPVIIMWAQMNESWYFTSIYFTWKLQGIFPMNGRHSVLHKNPSDHFIYCTDTALFFCHEVPVSAKHKSAESERINRWTQTISLEL